MNHPCREAHGYVGLDSRDRSGVEVYPGHCRHTGGSCSHQRGGMRRPREQWREEKKPRAQPWECWEHAHPHFEFPFWGIVLWGIPQGGGMKNQMIYSPTLELEGSLETHCTRPSLSPPWGSQGVAIWSDSWVWASWASWHWDGRGLWSSAKLLPSGFQLGTPDFQLILWPSSLIFFQWILSFFIFFLISARGGFCYL